MKTSNPGNRRFCDVGDIFYSVRDDRYMICTSYYKSRYMHYTFFVKDYEELMNGTVKRKIGIDRVYTRYNLDSAWSRGLIKSLDPSFEAKVRLAN